MHFEMRESLKQKMLSLFRFKGSSEYCLLHKRNGEKCVVQITSAGLASVAAFDEKGKRLVFIMDGIKGFDGPLSKFETLLGTEKQILYLRDRQVSS